MSAKSRKEDYAIDPEIESLLTPLTKEERAGLESQILDGNHIDPIVIGVIDGKEILADGHNRRDIGIEHNLPIPLRHKAFASRETLIQWVIDNQLGRRNLTEERKAYYRGMEYLNTKKSSGRPDTESRENLRNGETVSPLSSTDDAIGKKHGVSGRTVVNDAAFAEAVNELTDTEKEAVLSGNSGQTKKAIINGAAPILCNRCARVGAVKDCEACAEMRKSKRKPKEHQEETPEVPDEPAKQPTDAEGHVIPDNIRPAFDSLEQFKAIDALLRQSQKSIHDLSEIPGGEDLRRFLKPTGSEEKTINKNEHLNSLKRDIRFTRPHSVCPYCKGTAKKDCKGCKGLGWITETTWKDYPDDVKERIA